MHGCRGRVAMYVRSSPPAHTYTVHGFRLTGSHCNSPAVVFLSFCSAGIWRSVIVTGRSKRGSCKSKSRRNLWIGWAIYGQRRDYWLDWLDSFICWSQILSGRVWLTTNTAGSWCSQTGGRCQDKEDEIQEESKADLFVSEAKRCLKQTRINFCIERTLYKDQVLFCFLLLGMQHAAYTKWETLAGFTHLVQNQRWGWKGTLVLCYACVRWDSHKWTIKIGPERNYSR
jgi:hypothetical protein